MGQGVDRQFRKLVFRQVQVLLLAFAGMVERRHAWLRPMCPLEGVRVQILLPAPIYAT
jgi:hypothetical protein